VLGDGDLEPLGGEQAIDALPAGAVDERAVNQDDVGGVSHGEPLSRGGTEAAGLASGTRRGSRGG